MRDKAFPATSSVSGTSDIQSMLSVIQAAVTRLIEVVDQETIALRTTPSSDLKDFNARKAHALLDLDRATRSLKGVRPDEATLRLLASLREKLDLNQHVLSMHIEAVREIAGVIADTIREADSDGTYTHSYRSKG
jgi:hypothetical protein